MRKIEKVDQSGQFETPFDARITRNADDPAITKKYIITAERMDDVNWRDDDSVSFIKSNDNEPPQPDAGRTVIKTTLDGRTWLAAPNMAKAVDLTSAVPCRVETGGVIVSVFETDTKQNKLSNEQLNNIKAVPDKANMIDLSAHTNNSIPHVSPAERTNWNGKANATDLTTHVNDKTPHVSPSERENWNGKANVTDLTTHMNNTAPHVSSSDRTNWNGKANAADLTTHMNNTAPHVSSADRTNWDGKASANNLTSHTGNNTIHITSNERTLWNGRVPSVTNENIVYGTGAGGTVSNRSVSTVAGANHIVQRTAGGHITVHPTPIANTDAVSKQYVDVRGRWVNRYDAGKNVGSGAGLNCNSLITQFGTVGDGKKFLVEVLDGRANLLQAGLLHFRYGLEALFYGDAASENGIGYRIRIKFTRNPSLQVTGQVQASKVASAGNTNWYDDNITDYRIMRIDEWVEE